MLTPRNDNMERVDEEGDEHQMIQDDQQWELIYPKLDKNLMENNLKRYAELDKMTNFDKVSYFTSMHEE